MKKTKTPPKINNTHGLLCDYKNGDVIRAATPTEAKASKAAAKSDGGAGVIVVDRRVCFVTP